MARVEELYGAAILPPTRTAGLLLLSMALEKLLVTFEVNFPVSIRAVVSSGTRLLAGSMIEIS